MGAKDFRFRPGDRVLLLRAMLGLAAVAVLVGLGLLVPRPSADTIRGWAESTGPWFLGLFFVVHALVTVLPLPRTLFTVSAGFLFGPVIGIAVCVAASSAAAVLALFGVRALDARVESEVIARIRSNRAYVPVAARLRARGWLAVGALRLIGPAPFALVNYAAALSPVRLVPYLAGTVIGLVPGTVAIVLLGDALTGQSDPRLIVISGALMLAGVVALVIDSAVTVRH